MDSSGRDGLGLSLALYMGAIVGTLGVLAMPIYYAVGPQIYDNPRPAPLDPLLKGPIVGQRATAEIPLALIRSQSSDEVAAADGGADGKAGAKTVAGRNTAAGAKAKQAEAAHRRMARQLPRHELRRPERTMADVREPRDRAGFSLFNLFGG